MQSAFGSQRRTITASAKNQVDEVYDLKGANLITPDQIMPKGESPYNLNARMYARDVDDVRVAIKTRKGSTTHSSPVGSTANISDVASVISDVDFDPATFRARPFTPSSTNLLTQLDIYVKRTNGAAGPVIVEVYTDNAGAPDQLLAQSSINISLLSLSYQYMPAYFIDAPLLTNGTQYWVVVYTQEDGQGVYDLGGTALTGGLTSNTAGNSWVAGPTFRYRTYLSTNGLIKGFTRRSPANREFRTMFAQGTNIYAVPDNPATPTSISSNVSSFSTKVRFDQIDDKTFWVDGFSPLRQWDGTTESVTPGLTGAPTHVIAHKNRLFILKEGLRAEFSDLYNFESWPAVNFFYVGSPKSADYVTGWVVFQDNLIIFTHNTKYVLSGNDIGSFTMKQAVGTKGAINQESIFVERNYVYFVSDDGTVNRFNGISDELISDKLKPEFASIQNLDSTSLTVFNNQVRVYYSKSPSPTINRMALFDIVYEQWFLDTGKPIMGALPVKIGDNLKLVEFSSLAGWLFIGENGTSDLGKAIDFKYWTPYKAYGGGSAKKRIKRFRPILRASQARYNMKVGVDFNFSNNPTLRDYAVNGEGTTWGGGATWGGGETWGSTSLVDRATPVSGRAEHIQYRFEKKGVDTPIELYGYIVLFKQGRAR